jgi:hypothetical protein
MVRMANLPFWRLAMFETDLPPSGMISDAVSAAPPNGREQWIGW